MLENHDGDTLLPLWMVMPAGWVIKQLSRALCALRRSNKLGDETKILSMQGSIHESVAGVLYRSIQNDAASSGAGAQGSPGRRPAATLTTTKDSHEVVARKLVYFERLFFSLDDDFSLYIDRNECDSLLSVGVCP